MKIDQFAGSITIDGQDRRFSFQPSQHAAQPSQLIIHGIDPARINAVLAKLEDVTIAVTKPTAESVIAPTTPPAPKRSSRRAAKEDKDDKATDQKLLEQAQEGKTATQHNPPPAEEEEPESMPEPTTKGTADQPTPAVFNPPPAPETGSVEAPRQVPPPAKTNGTRSFEDMAPGIDLTKLAAAQNMRAVVQLFSSANYTDLEQCVTILEELKAAGFGSSLLERLHDVRARFTNQWTASVS